VGRFVCFEHEDYIRRSLQLPRVAAPDSVRGDGGRAMQVETDEPEVIERVAALVVSKAEVVC
jgi:hypothetical protein